MSEKIDWNAKDSFGWLKAYFGLADDATSRVIWRAVARDMARHWFVWVAVALGVHLFGHIVFKILGVVLHRLGFYWLAWFFDVEG